MLSIQHYEFAASCASTDEYISTEFYRDARGEPTMQWMLAMPFTCPTTHSGEWGFQDVNSL